MSNEWDCSNYNSERGFSECSHYAEFRIFQMHVMNLNIKFSATWHAKIAFSFFNLLTIVYIHKDLIS